MAKVYNLARMSTATTGTGTITLGSAVAGALSFASSGVADGETVTYAIQDGSNSEMGRGVYTSSGTTLTRSVLRSTNANAAITLSGSAEVFITAAAEDLLNVPDVGGRLTLTTGTPVLTSTVAGATTVYYTPYKHQFVPLYDGTSYDLHNIGSELSQATTDTTKSPAACTTNSNYDLFVWLDGATYRCTRGPAWTSDTARGTGAGTTELERVKGAMLNKVSITNGPAANRGTYVGTIRTNGSSQVDYQFGSLAAGGGAALLGVWNMYNRVDVVTRVLDSSNSWTYNSATVRSLNNSTSNRFSILTGLAEDAISVQAAVAVEALTSVNSAVVGIGENSTSSHAAASTHVWGALFSGVGGVTASNASYGNTLLGWNYLQLVESISAAVTCTLYGDNGTTYMQSGAILRMKQ